MDNKSNRWEVNLLCIWGEVVERQLEKSSVINGYIRLLSVKEQRKELLGLSMVRGERSKFISVE